MTKKYLIAQYGCRTVRKCCSGFLIFPTIFAAKTCIIINVTFSASKTSKLLYKLPPTILNKKVTKYEQNAWQARDGCGFFAMRVSCQAHICCPTKKYLACVLKYVLIYSTKLILPGHSF